MGVAFSSNNVLASLRSGRSWSSVTIMTLIAVVGVTPISSAQTAEVICFGSPATIIGTPGDDHLVGTHGDDVIAGLGGYDEIEGGGGNDAICGGSADPDHYANASKGAREWIDAGPGDDRIHTEMVASWGRDGDGNDLVQDLTHVYAGAGHDRYESVSSVDYGGSPAPVRVDGHYATGWGSDYLMNVHDVYGSAYDDVISGHGGVEGRAGNDTIVGTDRADHLDGGPGNDVIRALDDYDWLEGGPGSDRIWGGRGDWDVLYAGQALYPGRWVIHRGDDLLVGGPGDDELHEDRGSDVSRGGPGRDRLRAAPGADVLSGGTGRDLLVTVGAKNGIRIDLRRRYMSGWGRDRISGLEDVTGSTRADVIIGNAENNDLNGVDGEDLIRGLAGNDFLDLGYRRSVGYGGRGYDRCYVTQLTRYRSCRPVQRQIN